MEGQCEHHAALLGLLEIAEVSARSDLKTDLLQEIERQRQLMLSYRDNPDVSSRTLDDTLELLGTAYLELLGLQGKVGQHLRENDWLMSIKSRSNIPGGLCEFDLPSYHYWLNQPSAIRAKALKEWLQPLLPLRKSLDLALRLLRSSAETKEQVAEKGIYHLMLGNINAQMAIIEVEQDELCVPEVSANKYALNVRFTVPATGNEVQSKYPERDIRFNLALCVKPGA